MLFPELEQHGLVGIAKLASESEVLEQKRSVQYLEIETRTLLNRCTSPRVPFQWTINPYRGCEFGCKYCYARYTHEFMELEPQEFENRIFAKQFEPKRFLTEIDQTKPNDLIALGTATDPYQPAERRYGLTRAILEVFAAERGRRLSLITKSDLIVRDLDLLSSIARANVLHVSMTVTTMNIRMARLLEPRAPRPDLRMAAVEKLAQAGISTGISTAPILPLLNDSEKSLDRLGAAATQAGAMYFGGGVLFLKPCSRDVFFDFLKEEYPKLVGKYTERYGRASYIRGDYPQMIRERMHLIRERYGLRSSPVPYKPELWPETEQQSFDFMESA